MDAIEVKTVILKQKKKSQKR